MKALILNGIVVEVSQNEFEVHESLQWVDCDQSVQAGWSYVNGIFSAPPSPTEDQLKEMCKDQAKNLISKSDWSTLSDVTLKNQADFIAYRAAIRALIINPVAEPTWPTEPTPEWS